MSKIIGIGHRSGHGKDTFAGFLHKALQVRHPHLIIVKRSWAGKLKDVAYQLYGHCGLKDREYYETEAGYRARNIKLPKIELTPVEIWVKLGEAVRYEVWLHTWTEYLKAGTFADLIIVPDTRTELEIPYCDYLIKVINPRIPNRTGVSIDDRLAEFSAWDAIVVNDSDKAALQKTAQRLVDQGVFDELTR